MKKILVLDDDTDILNVVKLILENHSFAVETLSDWKDIHGTIQTYKPNLVLLDVNLVGADGRDICNAIKLTKETANTPVILFSARYDLINNLKGCEPNAILTKPFETSTLIDLITDHVN